MTRRFATVVLLTLLVLPAWADSHPRSLGERHTDGGYKWVAASGVLTASGEVKPVGVHPALRKGLEWQLENSARRTALEDGEAPAAEQCAPRPPEALSGSFAEPEQDRRFASIMLLSEVMATATVDDVIPGFFVTGNPGVLLALSDVQPLRPRSPPIAHVLVPVERMAASGRVFCAVMGGGLRSSMEAPGPGRRVVVMGEWSSDDVVRVQTMNRLGTLATVDSSRDGRLRWDDSVLFGGPGSLAGLRQRVEEALVGGLFDMTSHLVRQPYGSGERREFVERWARHESDGCRVVAVAERPGVGVAPVHRICFERLKR